MKKIFLLLLLFSGLVQAIPTCPNYPYRDFVWASDYRAPLRPLDSLLDNCPRLGLRDPQVCSVVGDPRLTVEQQKQFIVDDLIPSSEFGPLMCRKLMYWK